MTLNTELLRDQPERERMIRKASVPDPTPEMIEGRRKWVALLRSGTYEQFPGALCSLDGKKRCCLGVATDPSIHGIDLPWEEDTISRHDKETGLRPAVSVRAFQFVPRDGREGTVIESAIMPQPIADALGFTDANFYVWHHGYTQGVAALNDSGVPFATLADLIEADYITPFINS